MIGVWTILAITAFLFQHTVSIPGLNYRDLIPPTRTDIQDISKGAPGYLLPVPGGLHNRRLLWFWGNDDEDESDTPTSTVPPYTDGVMTTERPPWWRRGMAKMSRGMSKVGGAFKELGTDIKEAANATKWKMKAAGTKIKNVFKKGYRKIKMKISGVDDKFNNFANRLKIQVENGNEKALRLLQKLGINVHVEDKNVIGVDVEDEIDSVSNILKVEGVLKEKSTTPHYIKEKSTTPHYIKEKSTTPHYIKEKSATPHVIVTNVITQSLPVRGDVDINILSTSSGINAPVDNVSNLGLTTITNLPRSSKTESSVSFTEHSPTEGKPTTKTLFPSKSTKAFTNTPTINNVNDITSSTSITMNDPKNMDIIDSNTEFTTKLEGGDHSDVIPSTVSTRKFTADTEVVLSTAKTDSVRETNEISYDYIPIESSSMEEKDEEDEVRTDSEHSTMAPSVITNKSTSKYTENLHVTDLVSLLVYTSKSPSVITEKSTPKYTENLHVTDLVIPIVYTTKTPSVITEKSTSKYTENLHVTDLLSPIVYTTKSPSVIAEKSTSKHIEYLHVTDLVSPLVYTTRTVTVTNKISTTETPKSTVKIVEFEQPFKSDSPSILENVYYDEKNPAENSSMEEDEEEEVYSPPPFPDVFNDNRIKDRLRELYEEGDFTHSELSDLFDPDYYEYYYDYA